MTSLLIPIDFRISGVADEKPNGSNCQATWGLNPNSFKQNHIPSSKFIKISLALGDASSFCTRPPLINSNQPSFIKSLSFYSFEVPLICERYHFQKKDRSLQVNFVSC